MVVHDIESDAVWACICYEVHFINTLIFTQIKKPIAALRIAYTTSWNTYKEFERIVPVPLLMMTVILVHVLSLGPLTMLLSPPIHWIGICVQNVSHWRFKTSAHTPLVFLSMEPGSYTCWQHIALLLLSDLPSNMPSVLITYKHRRKRLNSSPPTRQAMEPPLSIEAPTSNSVCLSKIAPLFVQLFIKTL